MSSTAVTGRVREDCMTSKAISLYNIAVFAYKAFLLGFNAGGKK